MQPEKILSEQEKLDLIEIERNLSELFEVSLLTMEQLEALPYTTPEVLTDTGGKEVNERILALTRLGYLFINPFTTESGIAKRDGKWQIVETAIPPFRSEVITAFFIYRLVNEFNFIQTGRAERFTLTDGDKPLPKRTVVTDLNYDFPALTNEQREQMVKVAVARIMEHRVDTTGVTEKLSGTELSFEKISRQSGNKANSDGRMSIAEIKDVSARVLAAVKDWKARH